MRDVIPQPGEHIAAFAARLVCAARHATGTITATFNDIPITATPDTAAADIVAAWDREMMAQREAYLASDAGKADAAKRRAEVMRRQAVHDELVADLANLPWSDDIAILRWWDSLAQTVDHVGVVTDSDTILRSFKLRGFKVGANTGDRFREDDRDNSFRYLVGQGLDGLVRVGCPHPIIGTFIERFIQRWGRSDA